MTRAGRDELATLIYYPEEKLEDLKNGIADPDEWYNITIHRLVEVCRLVAARYTRSKVRQALPDDYSYLIEERLHTRQEDTDETDYFESIISTIIDTGQAPSFISAICGVIKRL